MQPLVNIMLPVYNGMPLLKASIESIRRQTYTNWQCIICDDGSTDGTWEYLQTLHEQTHNSGTFLLLRNTTNRGRGYTRQRILQASTGTYICMLDAGDLMHPDRIRLQVEYLQTHPDVGLVSTSMLSFGTHTHNILYRGSGDSGLYHYGSHSTTIQPSHAQQQAEHHATPSQAPRHTMQFPCFAPSMFRNPMPAEAPHKDTTTHHAPHTPSGEDQEIRFQPVHFSEDHYFLTSYFHHHPLYYTMPEPLYYYSEYDSVTKTKIRQSYLQNIHIYHHQHMPALALTFLLKYLYAILIFPFLSTEHIVSRRGTPATPQHLHDFTIFAKPLLDALQKQ